MPPEECFDALVAEFVGHPEVTLPGEPLAHGFGAQALKVHGSIFAMLSHGHLVVKLPRDRVAALIAVGTGAPFDAGKGKPMKEWLTVLEDNDSKTWLALARDALAFVQSRRR